MNEIWLSWDVGKATWTPSSTHGSTIDLDNKQRDVVEIKIAMCMHKFPFFFKYSKATPPKQTVTTRSFIPSPPFLFNNFLSFCTFSKYIYQYQIKIYAIDGRPLISLTSSSAPNIFHLFRLYLTMLHFFNVNQTSMLAFYVNSFLS